MKCLEADHNCGIRHQFSLRRSIETFWSRRCDLKDITDDTPQHSTPVLRITVSPEMTRSIFPTSVFKSILYQRASSLVHWAECLFFRNGGQEFVIVERVFGFFGRFYLKQIHVSHEPTISPDFPAFCH